MNAKDYNEQLNLLFTVYYNSLLNAFGVYIEYLLKLRKILSQLIENIARGNLIILFATFCFLLLILLIIYYFHKQAVNTWIKNRIHRIKNIYAKENTIQSIDENDDQPINFEAFAKIYQKFGGFDGLFNDLNSVSKLIISTPSASSVARTICLNGQWGTGKTSYLNILKDFSLEKLESSSIPIDIITINSKIAKKELIWVADFQPWNFGNSSEMITEFFKVLSKKTGEAGLYTWPWRSLKYNNYATLASSVFEGKGFLKTAFQLVFPQKNMPKLKEEIRDELQKLTKKIVFVLDDTDRESPEMVSEVMRLVKSVADFPNLIFILPFDYNKVSSIITKKYGVEYENYLQKIINNTFQIDNYSYKDLESIFVYEFRNSRYPQPLLRKVYEYYRIQVWLIGFRQKIDWLINNKILQLEEDNLKLASNQKKNLYICKVYTFWKKIVTDNNNITSNINDIIQELNKITLNYHSLTNSNLELNSLDYINHYTPNINQKILNELLKIYNNSTPITGQNILMSLLKDTQNNDNKGFANFVEAQLLDIDNRYIYAFRNLPNRHYIEFTDSTLLLKNKIISEKSKIISDVNITDSNIRNFLQEFAPSPRDIKAFANKIINRSGLEFVNSDFILGDRSKSIGITYGELDYIISNQRYNFEMTDEPVNRPTVEGGEKTNKKI